MQKHNSQRGWFAYELYQQMKKNKDIYVLTGDLGFGMLDHIRDRFPSRFLNVGASEQVLIGTGIGLALEGKIPFVYSITTFLLYRPFETIRNYIHHENIPVILVGGGRDKDYLHDGWSHWAEEDKQVMNVLFNIRGYWPETKEEIPDLIDEILIYNQPTYLNLRR